MGNEPNDLLERAFADDHLQLIASGKTEKIRYVTVNVSEKWTDPEEKVRAAYYAELIYRYGYAPECIRVEVTVPDRTPVDRADLVVFRDKECRKPFAVIECKRDGISDTELKQAVEQAFGNGHAHKFRAEYIGVIAGQTRAFYDCSDKFGALEREANIVADLPCNMAGRKSSNITRTGTPSPTSVPSAATICSRLFASVIRPYGAAVACRRPWPSANSPS